MKQKGFTLVELLAVIAIVAVLGTVAVIASVKIYNDNVKKSMIVQENNVAEVSRIYLEDYCLDPLDNTYKCPESYENINETKYICLSDLQDNIRGNYVTKVNYKKKDCKGIITFSKNNDGEYVNSKTYLYCNYSDKNNKYEYVTDETLDTTKYPRCNIYSKSSDDTTTTTTKKIETACTYDGELKQGAEYVNGQYTYRYMQQGKWSDTTDLNWSNMYYQGWGVQLTDKDSADPVTTKLCTSINGKPIVSLANMFFKSNSTSLDLNSFDTSKVTNMSEMFAFSKATIINGLNNFNTENVTRMDAMFRRSNATTIKGLENFNTKKVTNMHYMFAGSYATTLDLSSFDTSNVIYMSGMFQSSSATVIKGLENFNTSKVTSMGVMFAGSKPLTLDLSSFDTSKVTDMIGMFEYCNATTIKGLEKFNTSNVTSMNGMFMGINIDVLNLSNFDTSKVTNMWEMFRDSNVSILDLSSFDTSKVTNMHTMFASTPNLKTIYASNKFVTTNVSNSTSMFADADNLVGGFGTKYNSSYVDKTYARVDNCDLPGYFSDKTAVAGSFATDSWATIISNVKSGKYCRYKLGDTKNVNVGTYGNHAVRIANMSTPSECSESGFSQTACGFVLEFTDSVTNSPMNSGTASTNVGGWNSSLVRTLVNNKIYNALPSDLRSGIINTTVVSGSGKDDSGNFTATDKLYLLSPIEVYALDSGGNAIKTDSSRIKTRQLDYYTSIGVTTSNYSDAIKKNNPSLNFDYWWLRSAYSKDNKCFFMIDSNGDWLVAGSYSDYTGISPAFRIG